MPVGLMIFGEACRTTLLVRESANPLKLGNCPRFPYFAGYFPRRTRLRA
jgi:hypothetical protein